MEKFSGVDYRSSVKLILHPFDGFSQYFVVGFVKLDYDFPWLYGFIIYFIEKHALTNRAIYVFLVKQAVNEHVFNNFVVECLRAYVK